MISRTDNKGPPLSWVIGIMAVVAWAIVAGADRYILHIGIGIGMRPGLVLTAIVFGLLWIPVYRWRHLIAGGAGSTLLGSARFGGLAQVAALQTGAGDLLIGRSTKNKGLLRQDGPAHLVTIAPPARARASAPSSPTC